MKTKFILIFLRAVIDVIVVSMREFEASSDKDSDGLPLSSDWETQSFLLASLRDIVSECENSINEVSKEV